MSQSSSGLQLRQGSIGSHISGAAKNLPATGSTGIFTVTGKVIVTSLIGTVSTAIQNQACTLSVGFTPSGGSAANTALATATSIINLAVGAMVSIPQNQTALVVAGTSPGVLGPGNGAGALVGFPGDGGVCILNNGTITITTSATNTGAITWEITYAPYSDSGLVAAL